MPAPRWQPTSFCRGDKAGAHSPRGTVAEKQLALLEPRRNRGGGPGHLAVLPGALAQREAGASSLRRCWTVCATAALAAGAKIDIDDETARRLVDTVIECTWDKEQQTWRFLRDRKDKDTPNAVHVYEKVVKSIEDDINEGVLLQAIEGALAEQPQ